MPSDGKTRFAMAALQPGTRLNDTYEIDAHVASGGMGEVYRGHNIETGEPVAIKAVLPELARDEAIFALFKKEATVLGRLRHDTIVRYYSFSRDPALGVPYLAMEFVEGLALSERIAQRPLGTREAAVLFARVAAGLAVAHQAGVIHRDLSPDNIILSNGDARQPRIIDFGIARSVRPGDRTLIGSGFAGKFDFVSPEQLGLDNGEVTGRSDIYSLALVMIAALKGKALDMGGTHVAVIEKRRSVPDLEGLDPSLLPLLRSMLAPDPAERPESAAAVANWLRNYLAARPATVPPRAAIAVASESPFGPGPQPAVAKASAAPATAQPGSVSAAATPPVRRFTTPLAAGLVALVLIGGAGAAYLGGLFDGKADGEIAAAQPAPAPADGNGLTGGAPAAGIPTGAAAEAAASNAGEPVEPKVAAGNGANEATQPAAPAVSAQSTAAAATTDALAGAATDAVAAAIPPDAAIVAPTEAAAAVPAAGASDAAPAAVDKHAAVVQPNAPVAAVAAPSEGDCFFATIAGAGGDSLALRGFAPSEALLETIARTHVDMGGSAPVIDAPLVAPGQCAAVDFLETVHPHIKPGVRLTLSTATPKLGSTLTATIAGAGERPVRLLLVDGEGKLSLLGAASKGSAADGSATITARVDRSAAVGAAPHIVVALVGEFPIAVPEGAAASYFPGLADTLLGSSQEFGLDFAHFRPSAPDEAAPFAPQPYAEGSIRPNHLSQAELDRALIDFYRQWKSLYIVQECGEGRYLLKVNADGKAMEGGSAPDSITVSEAHGYGMLALVQMAAADPEAQAAFNGMYHYRADHPARSSPHLMAWNQVEGCGNAGEEQGGDNSATDGDLDIAYALLLADKAWGSDGRVDYRASALDMIAAIMKHEVSVSGDFLLLGDWVATSDQQHFRAATRSSDFMLSHMKAFADATGEQRWHGLRDSTYGLIDTFTRKFSPKTGLMPDFIVDLGKKPRPAPANFMEGEGDGHFSWNAARYPWRVGLDYLLHGEARAQKALAGLNKWVRHKVKDRPEALADTYHLDGTAAPGSGTGALTFVALMGVAAMVEADNQAWLNAVWDNVVAQKIEDDDFYGNTLKLMAMIAMSGHWAKP